MDIQKWLENTADREPPDGTSDDLHIPDFLPPDRIRPSRVGATYRHKRKRASTDSSIIAPRPDSHRNAKAPVRSSSPDHVRGAEDAATGSQSAESSDTTTTHRAPAKTYEKRPRHRTRPDRYEPKAKKRKQDREGRKEREAKQKRRKSHRSGDGGRTAGLVQSFQLKNGPKNNRLTVSLQ